MKNVCVAFFLLIYFGATAPAVAQEGEEGEFSQLVQEFAFVEPVYLQEPREVQATLNYFRPLADKQAFNSLGLEVEYGIADWVQLSTELERTFSSGTEQTYSAYSLSLGPMARLFSSARHAASFSMHVAFPLNHPDTAVEGAEEPEVSYTPILRYAREFGNTQLHLSGGSELQQDARSWFYNAAAVYGSGRWHPLLELTGTYEEEADWYLGTGVAVNKLNGWELIAGARRSLHHPDWEASVKVLYEFSLGKE